MMQFRKGDAAEEKNVERDIPKFEHNESTDNDSTESSKAFWNNTFKKILAAKDANDAKEIPEKIEPPVVITFKCPEGVDRSEFKRQLKGQERGINSQSVAENMKNRQEYQERKEMSEVGNGRAKEAAEAQRIAREKAYQSRIASNIKKKMTYGEAKKEADSWIKTQAALHNPDQIAGGNPIKVSRMGDAKVNSSIGSQWKSRIAILENGVNKFAENYSEDELKHIKMNIKLEVE